MSGFKALRDIIEGTEANYNHAVYERENNMRLIGKSARDIRIASKISLRELARRMGLSAAYLSDLERGFRHFNKEMLDRYAGAIGGGQKQRSKQ